MNTKLLRQKNTRSGDSWQTCSARPKRWTCFSSTRKNR